MAIDCTHPRPDLHLPNRTSGRPNLRFTPPAVIPGIGAEASRVVQAAFRAIQSDLSRLSGRGATVPMLDAVIYAKDGQTIQGVGNGQAVVLPQPPAVDGVRIVLDDVVNPITVVGADGEQTTVSNSGIYEYSTGQDGSAVAPAGSELLGGTPAGAILGRESADTGEVEALAVGGGLELNSGLQVADGGITTAKIADLAVTATKLADPAVTTAKLAAEAVTTGKLADLSVTTAKLEDLAVATGKIQDLAVTTDKLDDAAVTNAKLDGMAAATLKGRPSGAEGPPTDLSHYDVATELTDHMVSLSIVKEAVDGANPLLLREALTGDVSASRGNNFVRIRDSAVTTDKLDDAAVTNAKLGDSAVTKDKLDDAAVTNAKLGDSAVTTDKLDDAAVTNAKLGDSAVTTDKLDDAAVTNAKLGAMRPGTVKGAALGLGFNPPIDLGALQLAAIVASSERFPTIAGDNTLGGDNTLRGTTEMLGPTVVSGPMSMASRGALTITSVSGPRHNVTLDGSGVFLLNLPTESTITGLVRQVPNQLIHVCNVGNAPIVFDNEGLGSDPSNRFNFRGSRFQLLPGLGAAFWHDTPISGRGLNRWLNVS